MSTTMLLLLMIIGLSGIASSGCIIWADDLTEVIDEIKSLARLIL